jgi:DNA-binding transcriptional LysR family regulator
VVSWAPGVLDRFDSGQIDALIGDFGRVPDGYEARALFEDRLVWLIGREYILTPGLADRRVGIQAVPADVSSRVVWESGFERRTGLEEYCGMIGNPVDGIECRPAIDSLPYSMIAPLVVKQTDLAALLPRRLAVLFARDLRLDVVEPLTDAVTEEIRIAAIRHPDHGNRAPVTWFCELLTEAAATLEHGDSCAPHRAEHPGGGAMS